MIFFNTTRWWKKKEAWCFNKPPKILSFVFPPYFSIKRNLHQCICVNYYLNYLNSSKLVSVVVDFKLKNSLLWNEWISIFIVKFITWKEWMTYKFPISITGLWYECCKFLGFVLAISSAIKLLKMWNEKWENCCNNKKIVGFLFWLCFVRSSLWHQLFGRSCLYIYLNISDWLGFEGWFLWLWW